MTMQWIYLFFYCASQAASIIFLKMSTVRPESYWWYFTLTCLMTALGIWMFGIILKIMNPNVAAAMGMGGTFVAGQILLILIFGSRLSAIQTAGVVTIFVGLMMLALAPATKVAG
jgi:multidrug transporter EmrE-like cation transporter